MARALEPGRVVRFDDDPVSSGARVADAPFAVPETIPPAWVNEGQSFLRDFGAKDRPACKVPGGLRVVKQWMLELIGGYPHGMDAKTLHMRGRALVDVVEDFPLWCFTRETRKAAAQTFGFVPGTKEIADFIRSVDDEVRRPRYRIGAILKAAKAGPMKRDDEPDHQRPDWTWSREAAERHGRYLAEKSRRELAELGAILRERDAKKAEGQTDETA